MTLHLDYGEDRYLESHGHVMGMSWHIPKFQPVPVSASQFHLLVAQGSKSKGHEGAADTGHFPRLTLAYEDVNVSTKRTQRNGKERK